MIFTSPVVLLRPHITCKDKPCHRLNLVLQTHLNAKTFDVDVYRKVTLLVICQGRMVLS